MQRTGMIDKNLFIDKMKKLNTYNEKPCIYVIDLLILKVLLCVSRNCIIKWNVVEDVLTRIRCN